MRPQNKVNCNWSSDLAYAVGLLVTDGALSVDGRHINFTSGDLDLIETFRDCLKIQNKIGIKVSGFTGKKDCYQIQFGDISFYKFLTGIGLKPNKSRTLGRLSVPSQVFAHFVRGCFDGDGTIYAYWDRRWRNSWMFYVCFASASPIFLNWLKKRIKELLGASGYIGYGSHNTLQLKYSKHEARTLLTVMYKNPVVPRLARKYNKALAILAQDPYPIRAR
ncbi:MAG: hypothetical protein V1895_00410 [Parcubacteria group bacterium]